MEGKPKDGKRRRVSFRYDPRIFSKLESICSQAGGEPAEQAAFHGSQQIVKDSPSLVLLGCTIKARPKPVFLREGHVLVCGMPQQSGKTRCIEGLLSRWPGNEYKKKKIIAFISKQEAVYSGFRRIKPFINTNPDPDFLSLLVESILVVHRRPQVSRKINLIMAELCHNAKSLKQVLKNATRMQKKVRYRDRIKRDACIVVNHYLAGVFPQGQDPRFAQRLEFNGNNNLVINLNHFSTQIQTLVIGSVAYEILKHQQEAVLVVPDGWTMFDPDGASLGRFHVESLISEGSQNRSYVVIESGFIGDIPPHIRRQMSTILLGYQLWGEEARDGIRALRNLAKHFQRSKPIKAVMEEPLLTRFDIQKLKVGEFQAFPSYLEEMGVWRVNKISTTPPQASSGEAIAHS